MYIHQSQVDRNMQVLHAVLWIRIGFTDPDPAFYLITETDPYPDPGRQIREYMHPDLDPDPGQTLKGTKNCMKNILKI
jgi:hypothetical protein